MAAIPTAHVKVEYQFDVSRVIATFHTLGDALQAMAAQCAEAVESLRRLQAEWEPKPEECVLCGSTEIAYHNYRDQPFCWPCADATSPQAAAQVAESLTRLDAGE